MGEVIASWYCLRKAWPCNAVIGKVVVPVSDVITSSIILTAYEPADRTKKEIVYAVSSISIIFI